MSNSLTPKAILEAYSKGFFPMGESHSAEIRWYHPDPRTILPLNGLLLSQGAKRKLKQNLFSITFDKAFPEVLKACASRPPTWINDEVAQAYNQLHRENGAHSVEAWHENKLVGGVYGVSLGGAFMAESMFHSLPDAGMIALATLIDRLKEKHFLLLDVQFMTDHLRRSGAIEISREEYLRRLKKALNSHSEWS